MAPYRKRLHDLSKARYEASFSSLQFELELFWKRTGFFWLIVGATFVASSASQSPRIQTAIASFGFVCSMVWTLGNRGSKYWYQNWENKLKDAEKGVTGTLYGDPESEVPVRWRWSLGGLGEWWFQAKRFSPSKLSIALSDYVLALWLCLLISRVALLVPETVRFRLRPFWSRFLSRDGLAVTFAIGSVIYAASLILLCRGGDNHE